MRRRRRRKVLAAAHAALIDEAVAALDLDDYAKFYRKLAAGGADSALMVLDGTHGSDPVSVEYIHIKPGGDPAVVEKVVRSATGAVKRAVGDGMACAIP